MKLTARNPKLLTTGEKRSGMGLELDCPCEKCVTGGKVARLGVWFANPLDGGKPNPKAGKLWQREGDSLETLTIAESFGLAGIGHWSGTIAGGEVVGGYEPPVEALDLPDAPVMPEGDEPLDVAPVFDPPPGAPA